MTQPALSTEVNRVIETEETACPNGCITDSTLAASGGDVIHSIPGDYRAMRCAGCGLVRTTPRPTLGAMGAYYPSDYGPYRSDKRPPLRAGFAGGMLQQAADWANGTSVPNLGPGTVLEIGCATGWFLDRMRAQGWRTLGVEISPAAAGLATSKGHQVWSGAVEQMPDPPVRANLIVGWMVLEHLHDPIAALRRLHSISAPGALCAFSVPRFGSLGHRLLGQYWILLDLPRHLFHYEPKTLGDMLRRCGWEPEKFAYSATAGFALSSMARFIRTRGWNRTSGLLQSIADDTRLRIVRRLAGLVLGITRQSGAMTVWARRKE